MKLKIIKTLNDILLKLFSFLTVASAAYFVYIIGVYFILVAFLPSTLETFNHKLNVTLFIASMLGYMIGFSTIEQYTKRFHHNTKENDNES